MEKNGMKKKYDIEAMKKELEQKKAMVKEAGEIIVMDAIIETARELANGK